jgi:hypothetical protein
VLSYRQSCMLQVTINTVYARLLYMLSFTGRWSFHCDMFRFNRTIFRKSTGLHKALYFARTSSHYLQRKSNLLKSLLNDVHKIYVYSCEISGYVTMLYQLQRLFRTRSNLGCEVSQRWWQISLSSGIQRRIVYGYEPMFRENFCLHHKCRWISKKESSLK